MAAMLTCAIFISVFASTDAEANFATFNKGDKFALKGEKDLSLGYHSASQLLTVGSEDSWLRNAIIENSSMAGYMSSAMLFEVIDVTDSEYVMKITAAQNISLDAELRLTGELVSPGTYIEDWDEGYSTNPNGLQNISEADATVGSFGFDAELVAGANETYIVYLQKSDMAVKSVELSACVYARGHLELINVPNNSYEWDSVNYLDIMNITSYESCESNISLDFDLSGRMSFDPYLTVVRDGPDAESTWEVDTYINGTFNWTGLLDVTGLPESVTDEMFDDDSAAIGITGFPIDLAKIYSSSSSNPRVDNGTMAITAEQASFEFSNLGYKVVNDPVYGNITVYRLGFNNATQDNYVEAWYYPAEGCLVGMEMNIPMASMFTMKLDMKSVPVDEAESHMTDISEQIAGHKTYEQVNTADVAGSNGLMDLLPIIALIAVAVIAVVGIVFFMKRKPKA